MDEPICRLCLRTTFDDFPISDDLRAALDSFLLKLVVNVTQQQNMICSECRNNLQIFYNFKRACLDIGNRALPAADCKSDVSMDLEDVHNKHIKSIVKNLMTCNFCTKIVDKLCIVSLAELRENTSLVDILEKCNPELSLNNAEEIVSCVSCRNSIEVLPSFIKNCVDVEEKVRKYTEIEGTDDNGEIDLKKVQEFSFKPILEQEMEQCKAFKVEAMAAGQEQFVIKSESDLKRENEDDLGPLMNYEEIYMNSEDGEDDETSKGSMEHQTCEGPSTKTVYTCKKCAYETTSWRSLSNHRMTHTDPLANPVHKCELCTYQTRLWKYFSQHMVTHKDDARVKKYKCEHCPYEAITWTSMDNHRMTHTNRPPIQIHKCEVCTYETKQIENLKRHMVTHKDPSERIKYKCKSCTYETVSRSSIWRHMFTHKGSETTVHKCKECTYETKLRECLEQHILTHRDRKRHECKAEQIETHKDPSSEGMHQCGLCPYETKRPQDLKRHVMTHKDNSEREKFKCKNCPYETITKSCLKRHMVTHKDPSTISIHKCDVCQYETNHADNMRRHNLTHNDLSKRKKYRCEDCTYETISIKSIKRHLVTHKGPLELTMHRCELCAYETKHIADMRQHMKTKTHIDSSATVKGNS